MFIRKPNLCIFYRGKTSVFAVKDDGIDVVSGVTSVFGVPDRIPDRLKQGEGLP